MEKEIGYAIHDGYSFAKADGKFTIIHEEACIWKSKEKAEKVLKTYKASKRGSEFLTYQVDRVVRKKERIYFIEDEKKGEKSKNETPKNNLSSTPQVVEPENIEPLRADPLFESMAGDDSNDTFDDFNIDSVLDYSVESLKAELGKLCSICSEETLDNLDKAYKIVNWSIVDIEHKYEFADFSGENGEKLAIKLANEMQIARVRRRKIKDMKEFLERFLMYNKTIEDMFAIISKYSEYVGNRTYSPRVRGDLFED